MEIEISKRRKGLKIFIRDRIYSKARVTRLICKAFIFCPKSLGKRRRRSCTLVRALV